jgi:hypothetical protein
MTWGVSTEAESQGHWNASVPFCTHRGLPSTWALAIMVAIEEP